MQNLKVIENDLVPVYETSTGEKVVYGTELHEILGAPSVYREWVKRRLNDVDAVENEDFEGVEISTPSRQKLNQHIIKLDTAKEMAMLERNEKGKQVRRYFIQVEKKYKQGIGTGLSQDNYLKLAEVVSSCGNDRFPYISRILDEMGLRPTREQGPVQTPADDPSVSSFLVGADVMNRPTNDVYQEYVEYCSARCLSPMSNIIFSKMANRILGLRVIDKKINGKKRRVFIPATSEGRRF